MCQQCEHTEHAAHDPDFVYYGDLKIPRKVFEGTMPDQTVPHAVIAGPVMMASNGYLPSSALSPIIGGGYLRKDAARSWNAMAKYIHAKTGTWIRVNGPDSSYRPYARQVYYRNYWCNLGKCGNAAVPGTSNHGLGLACDVPPWVRSLIDKYGSRFGWSKATSDAPQEPWHLKWNGRGGPYPSAGPPALRRGARGKKVKYMQFLLNHHRGKGKHPTKKLPRTGYFGPDTYKALKDFQRRAGLKADGVCGPKTWKYLKMNRKKHKK